MELTEHDIQRLQKETEYLRNRSQTIAVPLFLMKQVLDAAEIGLNTKHQTPTQQAAGETGQRLACDDWRCGWRGNSVEVLRAADPFNAGTELTACPKCREQTIRSCCDEPACWEKGTIGTPTPEGYRWTCHKHAPKF